MEDLYFSDLMSSCLKLWREKEAPIENFNMYVIISDDKIQLLKNLDQNIEVYLSGYAELRKLVIGLVDLKISNDCLIY